MTCALIYCERPAKTRGWCALHYHRWWRHGDPETVKRGGYANESCIVEDCERRARARDLCGKHLTRFYKYGDTSIVQRIRDHNGSCSVTGCERPYYGARFCRLHRERLVLHGSATIADEMAEAQGNLCAICQRPPRGRGHESRLHLDHNHETGRLRGMLCGPCNKAIGLLGDDVVLLRAAITYLEKEVA